MKINTDSIMKGLQNEDLQMLAGAFFYAQKAFHDGAINGTLRMIDALIKDPHIPNFSHVVNELRWTGLPKDLLMLGLGGWIAEELKIHPKLTKAGNIAKNFAINGGIGAVIMGTINHASLLHSPGSSNSGSSSVGDSQTWRYNP